MNDFEIKFKEAIDFLEKSGIASPNKPVIPHDKRVGLFLYKKGFADEVVVAGILHDTLEWSDITEGELEEKFDKRVLELIKANSKDRAIEGAMERSTDMIKRCKKLGDDALAIKIADVLDSCSYYLSLKNEKEMGDYRKFAKLLLDNLSNNLKKVFGEDLQQMIL